VTSGLPITVNDTVLGYVNYFSNKGHRTIENGLIHAGKYRDMIDRIFTEEGVPVELIHLAQAESGFMPRALSKAAAAGMWQFVKFRGNEYGLRQTQFTDDRLDPEMATRAAARHLHDLYNEFGDWYLAIAAYNCGPGVIESAVERTGYADFWELHKRRVLPNETANYVPIILAMTLMAKYPKEYGLEGLTPDPALEYATLTLNANTNLNLIADLTGLPAAELRDLNPSLLTGTAPEGYHLKVPFGTALQVAQDLEMVPIDKRATWRMYRVQTGETLAVVGKKFGQSASAVAKANDLAGDAQLVEGQKLLIPPAYKEAVAVAAAKTRVAPTSKKKSPPKKKASKG
jgi:membrane-bound lytic murein transglycosylase D